MPGLVADLVAFCNRTDVDPIAQAAVDHAQFETIHPFTDGNGRTGRALVHVVRRRRGLARRTVVPISTVLLAPRTGSASARLLPALLRRPVVDIAGLRELTDGVADKNIYAAVDRLTTAGVLTEISGDGRNRVWAAMSVLDLLERVERRLGQRRSRLSAP